MENQKITTRRNFSKIALASAATLIISCSKKRRRRRNESPIVYVSSRTFENDGNVKYRIVGEDDVDVVEIRTAYNDEPIQHHSSSSIVLTKPVTRERNTLYAIAIDNRGAVSVELADSFQIPTIENAFEQVRQMLENADNFSSYQSSPDRVDFHLNDTQYLANFLITRNDKRYSIINIVSLEDNLQEQMNNQSSLNSARIDNLFLYRLPEIEITNYTTEFINAGYLSDFE